MPHLTTAQLQTLKSAIQADPTANGYLIAQDSFSLIGWCNAPKTPTVLAWRTAVPPQDADEAPSYSTFDTIDIGKRDSWRFFLGFPRNFTRAKVRNWVVDVWGSAIVLSNAEAVLQAGTEPASNAQAALGGTTRTTGTVSALARNFAGTVDQEDVNKLIVLP